MLVPARELLQDAQKGKYAVGQFNIGCFEVFKAVVEAAGEFQAPIILGTSENEMEWLGPKFVYQLAKQASEEFGILIALHLDHGKSLKTCLSALQAGYTSVHIDGSHLSFEENVALTLAVVEAAHKIGASCEGEIGGIQESSEAHEQTYEEASLNIEYTNINEADKYVKETGVDSLAIAIGNIHGTYKTPPKLNFELLEEINRRINLPLVLHGGSGIKDKDIKKAINKGICKININTEMRVAYIQTLKEVLKKKPKEIKPYHIFPEVVLNVKKIVKEKIDLFESNNKV